MALNPKEQGLKNRLSQVKKQDTSRVVVGGSPFERVSSYRLSKGPTKLANQSADSSSQSVPLEIFNKHQTSKIFTNKCRVELQELLDSIRKEYHDEFKALYVDESHADFFLQIGDHFQKSLHKCVIASRAFKLFSALRNFKVEDFVTIKVSDNQADAPKLEPIVAGEEKAPNLENPVDGIETSDQGPRPLKCRLPEDLISPELLLNLFRRAYLDQDLGEEEARLIQLVTVWLKANKPDLVRPSTKLSSDHRESFRTIQPDIEQLMTSRDMSPVEPATDTKSSNSIDGSSNVEEQEGNSETASCRDESLTNSMLTRTETFELISKNQVDSPEVGDISTREANLTDDESKLQRSNESETSEVYTPTTRTGLKPKQFTTPIGIKPKIVANKIGSPDIDCSIEKSSKDQTLDSSPKTVAPDDGDSTKADPSNGAPIAAKRSSLAANASDKSAPNSNRSTTSRSTKLKTVVATPPRTSVKTKPTVITRAHPISMERSQSPGTNLVKGSSKNFIIANKKLVSQLDKKLNLTSASNRGQQATPSYESETDISDSSFIEQSLTTDNLTAQLDKVTLVSQSKLAEALSRIFIDGLFVDSFIAVKDGKRIGAHKCILAVRSPYLNDLINQQCLPSASSEFNANQQMQPIKIDLSEYSYSAVYFSILHIYSGIVKVPDDLDLEELTKISHILHVNTLKQVCMHNLRMNYCHYFHKPCNICCLGVLKTLPLAWRYDYTELYSKCLQWIGQHFANIFCLEEFSKLKPNDLIEECYNATLGQLSPDNVIQKTIECQRLLKNLPRVKWTESIICLVGRQLEDFCHYVADNYEKILQTESFLNLGKSCWECEILEENLLAAMNHLKPDSGCRTLIQLDKIECSIETYGDDPRSVSESFANLIAKMRKYCERYLLKEASSVVHCSSWRQMNPSLQKRIKDQALLATDFDEPNKQLAAKPKLPSMNRHHQLRSSPSPSQLLSQSGGAQSQSGSDGAKSPSNRSTPDSRLKSPSTTYLPPPKNKSPASRQVKVLK